MKLFVRNLILSAILKIENIGLILCQKRNLMIIKIADINLADYGNKEIHIAESEMPN